MKGIAMGRFGKGMLAGFVATLVLSVVVLLSRDVIDLLPDVNPIRVFNLALVNAHDPAVAWALHFIIGTILWGFFFALLAPVLPGPYWLRGLHFGTGTWVLMMLLSVPVAAAVSIAFSATSIALLPFEGNDRIWPHIRQLTLPITTLVLNWIYGIVLGGVYGVLQPRPLPAERADHSKPS